MHQVRRTVFQASLEITTSKKLNKKQNKSGNKSIINLKKHFVTISTHS